MGDVDMSKAVKKVCRKRVNECTRELDVFGDEVLVSEDDSVGESPGFSVESGSMGSNGGDPMVPITPSFKCEGVDHYLGLDDCSSPIGVLKQELRDCGYKRKGGGVFKRERDFPSGVALRNKELFDCDYKFKGGGVLECEGTSSSPSSYPNQKLLRCDSQLKHGGFFSEGNPCTPKKDVFDPFAAAPEKLNLAPNRRKYTKELNISVVRKLKFDLCSKFAPNSEYLTVCEEEMIFQSVYSDIMETIISTQTKEIGKATCELPFPDECQTPIDATKENVKVSCELPLSDGCRTPDGATNLSGVANICPGAPVKTKSPRKFRRIDKRKCRKLDF